MVKRKRMNLATKFSIATFNSKIQYGTVGRPERGKLMTQNCTFNQARAQVYPNQVRGQILLQKINSS